MNLKFHHIWLFSFFILFFGFYTGGRFTVLATSFFLLINLIRLFIDGISKPNKQQILLLFPISLYLILFISSFYSEHRADAQFDLEQKLSLILFPILIGLNKKLLEIDIKRIFLMYVTVNMIFATFLIARFAYFYFSENQVLTYTKFHPLLHPTYLAAYITLNLIISFHLLSTRKHIIIKYISIISSALSAPLILLVQSKAGIIIFAIFFGLYLFKLIYQINKKLGVISIFIILGITIFIGATNPRFSAMIKVVKNYKETIKITDRNIESTGERLMVWNAAIQIISENYLFGVGNGDARYKLHEQYLKMGYKVPAELMLNSHNQYFEIILMTGIFGLILFLLMLIMPILYYQSSLKIIFLSFLLLFSLNFLFESMLNTQAGIILFMFFYTIFANQNQNKTSNNHTVN